MSATNDTDLPVRLLVRNIPPDYPELKLTMYFERRQTFGRELSVQDVDYDNTTNIAVVTFDNNEDLQTVLSRHLESPCHLQNQQLILEIYQENLERQPHQTKTIEVRGYLKTAATDTLKYYFENTRRSGGGPVEGITMETGDDETIYVTFSNAAVVESVMRRANENQHEVNNRKLSVRPLYMSDTELYMNNLPESLPEETIKDFLEGKCHIEVASLTFNSNKDGAVVCFKSSIDFADIQDRFTRYQLGGRTLKAMRVPVTNSILVTNIPDNATETACTMYFENKLRSGGGEVMKTVFQPDDGYCLINFQNEQDVKSVCNVQLHKLFDETLHVSPYYTCLGPPSTTKSDKVELPEPIVVDKDIERKLRLVQMVASRKESVDKNLENHHGKLSVVDQNMTIECTLSKTTPGYKKEACSWKKEIQKLLCEFVADVNIKKFRLEETTQGIIRERLSELDLPHPDYLAVFVESSQNAIVLVAFEHVFGDSVKIIQNIIDTVSHEVFIQNNQVTKSRALKWWQIRYLKSTGYIDRLSKTYEHLLVKLDEDNSEVVLQGLKTSVVGALLDVCDEVQTIQRLAIKLSTNVLKLLENKNFTKRISQELKKQNMLDIWEVKDGSVVVAVTKGSDLDDVQSIFQDFYETLHIPTHSSPILSDSKKRDDLLEYLTNQFKDVLLITQDKHNVSIYTLPEHIDELNNVLEKYLAQNSIYNDTYKIDENKLKFVQTCMKDRLSPRLEKIMRDTNVTVDYRDGGIIHITGTNNGIKSVRQLFKSLTQNITSEQRKMEEPGVIRFLKSEAGKGTMRQIEQSTPCLILVKSVQTIKPAESFQKGIRCSEVVLDTGLKVTVYGGSLTSLTIDVIVNASNPMMKHAGGLAQAVVKAGGQSIQDECTQYVTNNGQLDIGDVYMGKPGSLPCKAIAHAVGPQWCGGSKGEQRILQKLVKQCLKQTEEMGLTSIAFPALCTGMFRYPVHKSCMDIVISVEKYFKRKTSKIKEVYLCDINVKTVHGFITALKSISGNVRDIVELDQAVLQRPSGSTIKRGETQTQRKRKNPSYDVGKTTIELVKGNIVYEKVDIVVNSTSSDLNHNKGHASKALINAAGKTIETECNQKYPNGVTHGEVAVTTAGQLSSKELFHVATKPHKEADSVQIFQTTISNCLKSADAHQRQSIAFPAIGTGAHGFPAALSADTLFTSLTSYCTSNPNTTLTRIRVVLFKNNPDTSIYEAFDTEIKKYVAKYPTQAKPTQPPADTGTIQNFVGNKTIHLGSTFLGKPDEVQESCVLTVYAEGERTPGRVYGRIDKVIKDEWYTEKIADNAVWKLDQTQVQKIDKCATANGVYVCVDQDIGEITIEGLLKDASPVMDVICEVLRSIDHLQHEQQYAQLKAKLVRWCHFNGVTNVEFPEIESYRIEVAYNNKKPNVKLLNSAGDEYEIVFKTSQMHFVKQPGSKYSVNRRNLVEKASFKPPQTWDPMNAGEKLKVVPLASSSAEYKNVVAEFQKTLGRAPNILKVERVQNPLLYAQYQFKKEELKIKNPGHQNEKVLWHGTDAGPIQNIITNGFNRSYLNYGAYGAGVYFAEHSSYSDGGYARPDSNGHKRMMRTLVLVGQSTPGRGGMAYLPERSPGLGTKHVYYLQ